MGKTEVRLNEELSQFEMDLDDGKAVIGFKKESDGTLNLVHTEVPPAYEGKGVGTRLVKQTLEQIKSTDKKIVASCPFVADFIERHPEYQSLVK